MANCRKNYPRFVLAASDTSTHMYTTATFSGAGRCGAPGSPSASASACESRTFVMDVALGGAFQRTVCLHA